MKFSQSIRLIAAAPHAYGPTAGAAQDTPRTNHTTERNSMKAEIEIPDNLVAALDFMAECDGQTPDEYLQERVILYLQDWLYHVKDPNQGGTRSICGHIGGANLVAAFDTREQPTDSISTLQRCSVCLDVLAESLGTASTPVGN